MGSHVSRDLRLSDKCGTELSFSDWSEGWEETSKDLPPLLNYVSGIFRVHIHNMDSHCSVYAMSLIKTTRGILSLHSPSFSQCLLLWLSVLLDFLTWYEYWCQCWDIEQLGRAWRMWVRIAVCGVHTWQGLPAIQRRASVGKASLDVTNSVGRHISRFLALTMEEIF